MRISNSPVGTIAANIRRFAEKQGRALAHLADEAGIGRTTLWRILDVSGTGGGNPSINTVAAMAKVLGVELEDLVTVDATARERAAGLRVELTAAQTENAQLRRELLRLQRRGQGTAEPDSSEQAA